MTEHKEQEALFEWASYAKINGKCLREYMWATENGGSRNPIEARNLKKRGVTPGVPDVFLAWPTKLYHGLFIEMKRKEGGKVSPAQKQMHAKLISHKYAVSVCHGWEEAVNTINVYLKGAA